jgi:hypothetical protein
MVFDIKCALTDCDAIMMAPYDMSDIGEPAASGYISLGGAEHDQTISDG